MHQSFHTQVSIRNALSSKQKETITQLCTDVYEEDFNDFWTTFPDSAHVLGYQGDQLVCHAAWVLRWLQPAGHSPLRTAYVEAVVTDVAWQRHGFATQVMQRLQSEISDYDLGGLSENPTVRFWYARLGWESWRGDLFIRKEGELIHTPGEHCMILRLPKTPVLDLNSSLSAEWREGEIW